MKWLTNNDVALSEYLSEEQPHAVGDGIYESSSAHVPSCRGIGHMGLLCICKKVYIIIGISHHLLRVQSNINETLNSNGSRVASKLFYQNSKRHVGKTHSNYNERPCN